MTSVSVAAFEQNTWRGVVQVLQAAHSRVRRCLLGSMVGAPSKTSLGLTRYRRAEGARESWRLASHYSLDSSSFVGGATQLGIWSAPPP